MRDRAWRRHQARRIQKNRVKLNNQLYPYWMYYVEDIHAKTRKSRMLGGFKKRKFGCGCGCCKPWKHQRGRSEKVRMSHSDRKRFESSES